MGKQAVGDALTLEMDESGVATLLIDVPGRSTNVITPALRNGLAQAATRVASDAAIKGAVIASARPTGFVAGADLAEIEDLLSGSKRRTAAELLPETRGLSRALRALEQCGKPIAAAIEGAALGGGFEIALACGRRFAAHDRRLAVGLPEVKVGLMPGAGGTQRLPRMIGAQSALMLILEGKTLSPREARDQGLVDELTAPGETVDAAKAWILGHGGEHRQPWDLNGYRVPGGGSSTQPAFVQTFIAANALIQGKTLHNYAAPQAILSALFEGLQLPFDHALELESKYFAKLLAGDQAAAMVRTLFLNRQTAAKGARRPQEEPPAPTRKLAMIGAGLMGSGVALVAAKAGIEVVLLDRDLEAARKGKSYAAERLSKRDADRSEAVLSRIQPTSDFADLRGADLVIEAVFEDRQVKNDTIRKAGSAMGSEVIFGSNTSTLPITSLAESWAEPADFIGIHFFSPVEKMPLVEIILGKRTGPRAVAKALDFARQIGKTPIVVNDSRGFYTSRCFGTYVTEAYAMLSEGILPALIENAGRLAGMPVGPLAVADEVGIDLGLHILEQSKADLGEAYVPQIGDEAAQRMVQLGRLGRKNAAGFYTYPESGRKYLWPELGAVFDAQHAQPDVEAVKERLVLRQVVECMRCLAEGVIERPEDGDLGAVFGWGFAPFTGGPFSLVDTAGAANVVARLVALAQEHGERFTPPDMLLKLAKEGGRIHR